jgi:hypothetical protein
MLQWLWCDKTLMDPLMGFGQFLAALIWQMPTLGLIMGLKP